MGIFSTLSSNRDEISSPPSSLTTVNDRPFPLFFLLFRAAPLLIRTSDKVGGYYRLPPPPHSQLESCFFSRDFSPFS